MSESKIIGKHTPTPWLISCSTVYAVNADGCNRFSANVYAGHDDDKKKISMDEIKANANLIAAAPCLLQALEDMMLIQPGAAGCGDLSRTQRTMADARKAIARARGLF